MFSTTKPWDEEVERCDDCAHFPSDLSAVDHVVGLIQQRWPAAGSADHLWIELAPWLALER